MIGIFRVGVDFDLFCLSKIFEEGVFSRVHLSVMFLFSAILCCLVLFIVINIIV